ncbi:helix-turn-helix transcriptional regulator [Nocardioides lijunqiniae]|uniref:helix-turn-helix transcriptional regulator n=1 Tax=Nocardioides lijunqiniae TaxID=2760832 RepID=UPI0018776825|nr:response regulator transcription factor [Nocardioides lijunqiniae]
MSLKVALVEHHEMFAETLDLALSLNGHEVDQVPIPTSGAWGEPLVRTVLKRRPHVAILDVDADQVGDVARIIGPLTDAGVAVVVLTSSRHAPRWGECLHHGARRVVPKTAPLQTIVSTLRRLEAGLPVIPRDKREALVSCWRRECTAERGAQQRLASLTAREMQVLGHLSSGRQVRDIAKACVVSEATVRTQVKAILGKLDVGSQLAAVGLAHRTGWRAPQLQ